MPPQNAKLKRDLMYANLALESRRFGHLEEYLARVEASLADLDETERAEVAGELQRLREAARHSLRAGRAAELTSAIELSLDCADPRKLDAERFRIQLDRTVALIESDEVRGHLDAIALTRYRLRIAEAFSDADWPSIEDTIEAADGFDPREPQKWLNQVVRLEQVYNRVGWDYDPQFNFAMSLFGVAVAGTYDRHVYEAVLDLERRTHRTLDEQQPWDVIAVVEGEGTIKKRTRTELFVPATNRTVKIDSWAPTPCIMLRIIALHAGPVAVGPRRLM